MEEGSRSKMKRLRLLFWVVLVPVIWSSQALDLYNEEMRALPISVRIVEAVEAHEDKGGSEHSHAVFSLPPAVYGDGSIRADIEIPKAGHYIALMTLEKVGPGIAHKPHRGSEVGEWQRVS